MEVVWEGEVCGCKKEVARSASGSPLLMQSEGLEVLFLRGIGLTFVTNYRLDLSFSTLFFLPSFLCWPVC